MVQFMQMQAFFRKWKRDRAVSRVIRVGQQLRALKASRAGIEADSYEDLFVNVQHLDSEILRLEHKHAALILYLKSTA